MAPSRPEPSRRLNFSLRAGTPVYIQIEQEIRRRIQSGEWRAGDRIPSELEIMKVTGSSRATVSKALTNLANARLIVRQRKTGSHVRETTEQHSVLAMLDVRQEIESSGRKYAYQVIERRRLTAGTETAYWPEATYGERLLWIFATHCADGQPEVLEERLIRLSLAPDAVDEPFVESPPSSWLVARIPCTRIVHAIRAKVATASEASRLKVPKGSALLVSERRTWCDTTPVTWVRLSFPGSKNEFAGEFNPLNPTA